MSKYRKKPVVIDAVQWNGNMAEIIELVGHDLPTYGEGRNGSLRIATLEGDHECRLGDWIIKGVAGEFYPCKPEIFAATYEAAMTADAQGEHAKGVWRFYAEDAIAAIDIIRAETLEEAALVVEQRTSRQRLIYAKQNNQTLAPCGDATAIRALRRHDAYFHDHVLKMMLANMVRLLGVRETRRLVLRYTRNLKWF